MITTKTSLKADLQKRFKTIYSKNVRLLAIQLNGFSHKVFFDMGTRASDVICQNYSGCMPEAPGPACACELFKGIGHNQYQGQPKELIYILPSER